MHTTANHDLSLDDLPAVNPATVLERTASNGEPSLFVQVYLDGIGSSLLTFESPAHMRDFGWWLEVQADVVDATREQNARAETAS
jgi:hypothetical protein